MGAHSTPRGEHSTMQGNQPRGGDTPGYQGKHRLENKLAGSDLPARGAGIKESKPPKRASGGKS